MNATCKRCKERPVAFINDDVCEQCAGVESLRQEHAAGHHAGGLGDKVEKYARRLGIACPLCAVWIWQCKTHRVLGGGYGSKLAAEQDADKHVADERTVCDVTVTQTR